MASAEESYLFMPGKGANSDASKNSQGFGEETLRNFQVPSDNTREMTLQESSSLGDLGSGKLKLMCSFGGKILPRPSDRKLRYVGGQTRLFSVHTAVRFSDLMEKIKTSYGQALIMKYQLPDEDLDSLVSVTCDEDLHNMIEEYGRMTSGNDGVRIRLFLSSIGDQEYFDLMNDKQNSHQQYVDAINDAVETGLKISTEQLGVKSGVNDFLTSPMFADLATSTFQPVSIASSSGKSLAQEAAPTYLPGGGMTQYSNQSAAQDAIYPPGMQVNMPPSSKQATVSVPALVIQNASDASMNFFENAPNLGAQSYILRPMEGQQGKDAGGIVNSLYSHNPHYRLPGAVTTAEMSFQTTSAFSLPLDKQLLDSNFSRGDQYDQHIQLQNQQDMSQNLTENRFDVRQGKDLHTIPSLPSSSGPQSTWQTGQEAWNLQQSRPNQPSLLHVNGQQLAGVDMQNFIQTTQGQMLPPSFLNGASLQKTISNQQTGHHYLSVSDQAQGMVQFPGTVQTMCLQDPFSNEQIHGTAMFNFNDTGNYVPSASSADYYSNVSSDNVTTQPAFSNDHNYGMQQVLSTERPSHPNEVYHQPSSEIAFSEAISNVHTTTYEIPLNTDGSILSIPPYAGLSTMQDGIPSFSNFQNIDGHKGVGNQQAKETEVNSSGMQHYSMSTVSAEYAPPKQVVYPYYPENISIIGELDPKRQMEQDAISRQYLIDPKLSEPGSLNQQASHLVLNDHILQPKENYSGSSTGDFVDFSKQLDAKTSQPEFGNVALDTFKASDLPRQVQDVGPLNHGDTVLEARKLNLQQPLNNQLEGGVTAYSHSNTVANCMLGTGPSQGNLIEGIKSDDSCHAGMEKNTSGENNILRGVYNDTSSTQSYGSGVNQPEIITDGYSQPSITAPKSTSNASADGRKSPSAIAATEMSFNISDLSSLKDLSTELPTSGTSAPYTFESEQIVSEHFKAESHDFNRTGQGAFQSPLQSSLPMSNGNKHEGTETDNFIHEEESTFDTFDNDNMGTDASIAEDEAVARGLQVIKNADLEELQELGSGTFGTVYHGKWRGTDVAIKRIKNSCFTGRPSQQENMRADFWSEATLLAKLHHPNILAFYGVVPDGPGGTLGTVTEYMVNGSLKHVLQRKDRPVDYRKRVLIAMDAAFGMEYLHSKNIVHFDLKCENLLVNMRDPQRPICKVGDFGLSKIKHQTLVSGGVRGTLPWIAPELLNGSSHMVSEKVDVYSFGIVLWELLTGEEPYANMHYGAIIGGIVSNTLRPSVPDYCDPAWQALMEHCWYSDPSGRPTFTEIVSKLRAIAASLQSKGVQKQA